jgi:uncharacterized membrane protein YdbT with pleckstrin-like domain
MDETLMNGEEVVYSTTKHWAAPVADSWWAVGMILGALVLSWLEPDSSHGVLGFISRVIELIKLVLFLGGVAWIVYNVVNWRTALVRVTNLRVLGHEGLLRSRSTDTLLTSVSDVRSKASFVGRQLGYGDIAIYSASGEAGADRFTTVRNVDALKRTILEQKTQTERSPQAAAAPAASVTAGAPVSAQADPVATLASLGQLRDAGVISAEEFEAKKQELLSRV